MIKIRKIRAMGIRRISAILLLPFVLVGTFLVYKNSQITRYAYGEGDPLILTYDPEGPLPDPPMFVVTNMLPGDSKTKDFNVKNASTEDESVTMDFIKTDEEKDFANILDVEVTELPSTVIFQGKLQALFDAPLFNLGNFPAGSDKSFRVKVKFPENAGNEYQNAMVMFDIKWQTEQPEIEIPEDCSFLESGITRVVEGTEGNDFIIGNKESELFILKGGNDIVFGGKGNDIILGGEGNDPRLDGSDGNDCIIGGPGNDHLDGSDNNDVLFGNEGNDNLDGGGNDDLIKAGTGNDNVDGGAGNDVIYGEEGNDNIEGGSGNDNIWGGIGNDTIKGESGNDNLYGEEGNDNLQGGSGMDFLDGGADTDTLHGGSSTDTCVNGESNTSCEL
ncbi:hypothetical protein A2865_00210 [Candidatus Woesebacteria bacterium RIFCSPHIGHO2_01_FULL_39_17]|uniref:Hemolysin-type calcium-binding region n=3 Tax=Candidatus Woeseibacteriota TaxID=1752722 RepID=A0A0G0QVB1_9BACT|nr:MAG: hypothetical protein UT19_C0003G0016 [Candidatus Woesebacteria bacterium GW2011_GWB1_39_10b]KKR14275.1 MAG: hypothetical protein UT40_C0003G0017 [Candidatus Woesebacteria bacterium GW2011_GWA1_39_21b]OGM23655.1 MAG: hypothetical protein A2865_00210 [Candidatus Woesebacteria bacterium RIFCSPHIGHO2_01_FULL_39_17]OGM65477.1 MAG: hypothetical protein A3A52_00950 [Candidatus Woesebacteria bacterium RIFCSPLOWO2_01_FULL_39_14]